MVTNGIDAWLPEMPAISVSLNVASQGPGHCTYWALQHLQGDPPFSCSLSSVTVIAPARNQTSEYVRTTLDCKVHKEMAAECSVNIREWNENSLQSHKGSKRAGIIVFIIASAGSYSRGSTIRLAQLELHDWDADVIDTPSP